MTSLEYILSKLLPLFVYPLGLAITLVLIAGLLSAMGKRKLAFVSGGFAASLLWIASTVTFADFLLGSLEADFPFIAIEQQVTADAIVVLGGFTYESGAGSAGMELNDGIDRLLHGLRLYKASRAPYMVLLGGAPRGNTAEAILMSRLLLEWGVSPTAMLLEAQSRNTHENAINGLPLLQAHGIKRILLVTSAFHMRRAKGVFEKLGIEVVPAATDYQVAMPNPSILDWVPDAEALYMTTLAVKEYAGWWVYWYRDWL